MSDYAGRLSGLNCAGGQRRAGRPLIFVSADEGLLAAAVAEGLKVENPNRH